MTKSICCSVCGEELKFLRFGEKYDQEGNRIAKWPIWKKCSKVKHVKSFDDKLARPIRKQDREDMFVYQIRGNKPEDLFDDFLSILEQFTEKRGQPSIIRISQGLDLPDQINEIPITIDPQLTPGYRYVAMSMESKAEVVA